MWADSRYIKRNDASVCSKFHKYTEETYIPPQAFWFWIGIDAPSVPDQYDDIQIEKCGKTRNL
jgi:hypothetical protein